MKHRLVFADGPCPTPGPPIWPRWICCAVCGAPAGRHRGQRSGVRSYACESCLHTWVEPPLAFHTTNGDGEEIVVPAEQIDAFSQNGTARPLG